jgi:hypothetical protein
MWRDKVNTKKTYGSNKIDKYKDIIIEYVNNNEGCILNDIYEYINKDLSKPSICRILKNNNISRKKCNIRIVCKI